ncbi:DUF1617 family protein [Eupransor demetentiae]|uniref:Phage protein n=1 Tax=Eupransor demetentiae TaxID=3109584 RepID=A0ABM9N4L8_9LACO|nr:hypothetical protein R54876_GBNLAHCA_00672 [Lactobacillaceae bacterium LMG 33000]
MIKIKNYQLENVALFLKNAKLTGQVSRYRTRLLKKIVARIQELAEEEANIVTDNNFEVDEKGNIVQKVQTKDAGREMAKLNKELTEIKQERSIFEEDTEQEFSKLEGALNEYEEKLAGDEAEAYDILLDAFEEGRERESNH